jgi:hypothetical protein
VTTADVGTLAITENGTEFGILLHATTTPFDEAIVITSLLGKL